MNQPESLYCARSQRRVRLARAPGERERRGDARCRLCCDEEREAGVRGESEREGGNAQAEGVYLVGEVLEARGKVLLICARRRGGQRARGRR